MVAGEAALSTGFRGTWCPIAETGIYQTVKKFLSAWLPVLRRIPLFQSQELVWPVLPLSATPCTSWKWQPHGHWCWKQPFPPNAISSLTNFLPLPGSGPSPVTTGCPPSCVLFHEPSPQGLMLELLWILLQCGFHFLSHNKMDKPNNLFEFFLIV